MRLGGAVLSTSFKAVTGKLDKDGIALRKDFKTLADRARSEDIKFRPSSDRDNYDTQEVIFSKIDD